MDYKFNKAVDRIGTSSIKWDFQADIFGKDGLLPFFIADSDYPTAPEIIDSIIARAKRDGLGYTDADGKYLNAVSSWFKTRHNWNVDNSWIVPLSGVVSAMSFALMVFTRENDGIVIQSPVYNPFYTIVEKCGRKILENKLINENNNYSIDFAGLEETFKAGAKAMLFCNPHNPVGKVWSRAEVSEVARLCSKYNVLLISDEIHCDITLFGNTHTSAGTAECIKDNLIVCTSPGKTFNLAGLQCANIIIPGGKLRETYKSWLEGRYIFCPNIFALEACKAAYTNGSEWVDMQREHIEKNAEYLYDYFDRNIQCARVARLEGTYLMWIDFTGLRKSCEELAGRFVENGVAVSRGDTFGKDYDGFMRINIACPQPQLEAGLAGIRATINGLEI